jgi:hypothetical protein
MPAEIPVERDTRWELAPIASYFPLALDLGWEVTSLYRSAKARGDEPASRDDLPTLSDLADWQTTELRLDHVDVRLSQLAPLVVSSGLQLQTSTNARRAFEESSATLKENVYKLHVSLLTRLYAADVNLGKAYALGRSLEYTCSRSTDANTLRREFGVHRLTTLESWLADLASALPEHASRAVAISLHLWQESIPEQGSSPKRWQVKDDEYQGVQRALHRQAKLWRALLVGEKRGRDMLETKDYIGAAGRTFTRALRLAWTFTWRTGFVVPILLAAGGVAVWAILQSDGEVATKVVAAVGAGATAVGVSWKSTSATLGQLALKLEQPLWQREMDAAIGLAITTLDREPRIRLRIGRITTAPPPRGPAQDN